MKVLVLDNVSPKGVDLLKKHFDVTEHGKMTEDELIENIGTYDALVVRSETKVTAKAMEAAKNLKVIGRAGVGVDNIDVPAATQKGIIVLNAPDGNTIAATEHTVAMMLSLARHIPEAHASMMAKRWDRKKFVGVEMRGKTLGILGFGRIGSGVAKRALAMDMKVIAYDPFITEEKAKRLDIELADFDQVIAQADFVTFHLPLTNETRGMLNAERIATMKKGVRIINCARGGVIDEAALAEAIKAGHVAGAAIDVFAKEPLDFETSPLIGLPNVVLTPHLGASTKEAQVGVAVDVAHGIINALTGQPVTTAVNMAPISSSVLKVIQPYFDLAEKMGCLTAYLAKGRMEKMEVEYRGEISSVDTKMLTTAVLKGMLNPILQEAVNYVNAPAMAKARGIATREVKVAEAVNFANSIYLKVKTDKREHEIVGTLFGNDARIVSINGYRVDVDPNGWLLLGPHTDQPGMIGKVGTILGEHGINIESMQVGRTEEAGTNIMVMSVAKDIPNDVMMMIRAVEGIVDVTLVNFCAG